MRLSLLLLLFIGINAFSNEQAETPELTLGFVSDCDTIPESGGFSAGILFTLKPDWHLYWRNPGDTGLAPVIEWKLPKEISSGEIQWPIPHLITTDSIYNFGYSNNLLLPVSMQSQKLQQDNIELTAKVEWLVCKDVCIPGKAELRKQFKRADSCKKNNHETLFSEWRKRIPEPINLLDGSATIANNKFQLELYLAQPVFRDAKSVDIFIENSEVVSYQPDSSSRWKHNWIQWIQDKNDSFTDLPKTINAVIVVDHQRSYKIQLSTLEKL